MPGPNPFVTVPQKFASAAVNTVDEARALVLLPDVVVEQKLDGTRCLTVITRDEIAFYSHGGRRLTHAAAAQHFGRLRAAFQLAFDEIRYNSPWFRVVLDGEIMTETGDYWIFDFPEYNRGGDLLIGSDAALHYRREALEYLAERYFPDEAAGHPLHIVHQAQTYEDREALLNAVAREGGEGVMVKHRGSLYEPGKRPKHSLKVKFTQTADVVVVARNTHDALNAELAVYAENGEAVGVGSVSMIGRPDVPVGSVIEVMYLYRGAGGALYQPRMLRPREDKRPHECTTAQFVTYSKAVI